MRIDSKSVRTYLFGLLVGYCVIFFISTLVYTATSRNLLYPKNYYDLIFKPVPKNERRPDSVFIGKKDSKPFLEINRFDDKYSFSILDSESNKIITHDYYKSGLTSVAGKNWKFTPDQDDIVIESHED